MDFFLKGHSFFYEVQTVTQIFYPNESFNQTEFISDDCISVSLENGRIISEIFKNSELLHAFCMDDNGDTRNNIKLCVYKLLSGFTCSESQWGILTGVRPSKIAGKLINDGYSENEIISFMSEKYLVSSEKARLCIDVYKQEAEIIKNNNGNDYSLYIGIPFCPSRCIYCSFTSYPIEKYQHLIYNYINALEKEMLVVDKYFKNKRLENIYIGGGTPTSLDSQQLDFLLQLIHKNFDLCELKEFTVEAGRPDTVNPEKLSVMKKHGVTRISINPQTMNDKTLLKIGRAHTVSDFINSFKLAESAGFDNINVDLIIGLPGESVDDVAYTADEIAKLNPKSITVHTLAVKRASRLKEDFNNHNLPKASEIENMLKTVRNRIADLKMKPYYLYRQKNIMGNFENVGYCQPGLECFYNVQIMEEKQSVIAIGAGATSKIVDLNTDRIERIFNVKNIDDYLNRIDEMVNRKEKMLGEWFG